jgi:hypothetical protein
MFLSEIGCAASLCAPRACGLTYVSGFSVRIGAFRRCGRFWVNLGKAYGSVWAISRLFVRTFFPVTTTYYRVHIHAIRVFLVLICLHSRPHDSVASFNAIVAVGLLRTPAALLTIDPDDKDNALEVVQTDDNGTFDSLD